MFVLRKFLQKFMIIENLCCLNSVQKFQHCWYSALFSQALQSSWEDCLKNHSQGLTTTWSFTFDFHHTVPFVAALNLKCLFLLRIIAICDIIITSQLKWQFSSAVVSSRIVDRIFSGATLRWKSAMFRHKMSYVDYVWFILSEEDKKTPTR